MPKFCYNCGKALVEGTGFCTECGAPVAYGGLNMPNTPQAPKEEPSVAPQPSYVEPASTVTYEEPVSSTTSKEPTPLAAFEEQAPAETYEEAAPLKPHEEAAPKIIYEESPYSFQPQQAFASNPQQPFASQPQQPFASQPQQSFATQPQQPFVSQSSYQTPMQSQLTSEKAKYAGKDVQAAVGTGAFLGRLLLYSIPLIGWILCIVMSVKSKNENVKHFSRAMLLYILIGAVLCGIFIAICLLLGWELILFTADTFS